MESGRCFLCSRHRATLYVHKVEYLMPQTRFMFPKEQESFRTHRITSGHKVGFHLFTSRDFAQECGGLSCQLLLSFRFLCRNSMMQKYYKCLSLGDKGIYSVYYYQLELAGM
jgi:hypothetical protein